MQDTITIIRQWLGSGSVNLFGPPFSGKDTQARKLADMFGGVVVSGGDILRHDKSNTAIQRVMASGGIVPTEEFLKIIPPFFVGQELAGKPLFLSSLGRLMPEADVVMRSAQQSGHGLKAVVLLKLSDADVWRHFELSKERHDRGDRADDTRQALLVRLQEFARTAPVIQYYRDQGMLIEVDDAKDIDDVTRAILAALADRATRAQAS